MHTNDDALSPFVIRNCTDTIAIYRIDRDYNYKASNLARLPLFRSSLYKKTQSNV